MAQLVEPGVVALSNQAALVQGGGRGRVNGFFEQALEVGQLVRGGRKFPEPGRLKLRGAATYGRQAAEGLLERHQVPRVCGLERHAAEQAFEVLDLPERLP